MPNIIFIIDNFKSCLEILSEIITRGACGITSLKMGSFRRRVAILQTITSSPIGFAKRAQIHVL